MNELWRLHLFECPSVCQVCFFILNGWMESNQTCWMTCLNKWGMQEHIYFSICTMTHPNPKAGAESVCKGKIFASMFLYISFTLIWYVTWPCTEKADFWPCPNSHSSSRVSYRGLQLKSCLICVLSFVPFSGWNFLTKNIDNWLSYQLLHNYIFDIDPT